MFSFKPVVKSDNGEQTVLDDPADNDSGGKVLEFPKKKN